MVIDCRGVKTQACSAFKNRGIITFSNKFSEKLGKLVRKSVRTPDIMKFVTYVAVEVWVSGFIGPVHERAWYNGTVHAL